MKTGRSTVRAEPSTGADEGGGIPAPPSATGEAERATPHVTGLGGAPTPWAPGQLASPASQLGHALTHGAAEEGGAAPSPCALGTQPVRPGHPWDPS